MVIPVPEPARALNAAANPLAIPSRGVVLERGGTDHGTRASAVAWAAILSSKPSTSVLEGDGRELVVRGVVAGVDSGVVFGVSSEGVSIEVIVLDGLAGVSSDKSSCDKLSELFEPEVGVFEIAVVVPRGEDPEAKGPEISLSFVSAASFSLPLSSNGLASSTEADSSFVVVVVVVVVFRAGILETSMVWTRPWTIIDVPRGRARGTEAEELGASGC